MRGRSNIGPVLVAAVLALLLACASPAFAGDATITVSPATASFDVTQTCQFASRSSGGEATGTVLITNSGPDTTVTITALYANGDVVPLRVETTSSPQVPLPANHVTAVEMGFDWQEVRFGSGLLVLSEATQGPVTVPFQIRQVTPAPVLVGICFASGGTAAVMALIAGLVVWHRRKSKLEEDAKKAAAAPPKKPQPSVTIDSTWAFQGSWATNLTAAAGLLAAVLGATGFLSDILPGIPTGMYVGFNMLYLLLAAAAAVVYQCFAWMEGRPQYVGLAVAGGFSLWAAVGEVWTGLALLTRAGMWTWVAVLILIGTVVGLVFYALSSFYAATDVSPDWIDGKEGATMAAAIATAQAVNGPDPPDDKSPSAATRAAARVLLAAKKSPKDMAIAAGIPKAVDSEGEPTGDTETLEYLPTRGRAHGRTSALL